jgi:hypothetical protein
MISLGASSSVARVEHFEIHVAKMILVAENVREYGKSTPALEREAALLFRMAERADVLLEKFAPGVMDRPGVGWEVLHRVNPRHAKLFDHGSPLLAIALLLTKAAKKRLSSNDPAM